MSAKSRGSLLPLTYVFGSFLGAAMIAIVFAYNNYRFSKFKFIDFSNMIFYEKSEIFDPTDDRYLLVVFSSNGSNLKEILKQNSRNLKVIALDFAQKRLDSNESISYISSDINTMLKLVSTFNIKELPSSVEIVHQNGKIYKQDSKINKI